MTLKELDAYFRSFLKIDDFPADVSKNGIQIQNSEPCKKEIKKVAFAVDACQETALKAAETGADVLFVHHGLFCPETGVLEGAAYKKFAPFLKNDVALYACHIPLDANNPYGNNYGLAARIGLKNLRPFGEWRGMLCGVKGELEKPLSAEELARRVHNKDEKPLCVLPFGKKEIKTVGIVSGGGGGQHDVEQAVLADLDAYITGEAEHSSFHFIKESGINFIAMGHYLSETVGVKNIAKKLKEETGIETEFLDFPTGL